MSLVTRAARWLPALAVFAAFTAIMVGTGTELGDIARYLAYAAWAVVLPGTLIYRALRATSLGLVEDLAMGAALGLVLELAAFVLASVTDLRGVLWLWPAPIVLAFLAVPALRRHWLPRPAAQQTPLSFSWVVASVSVFLMTYLAFAFLKPNQPVPVSGTQRYFIDELFYLSLIGEAKHHLPLQVPSVAGQSLDYHWFAYAHMAGASTISGVEAPVVLFRLALPALVVLGVTLLAVVGWRVCGRPLAGAIATALTFAIGEVAVGSMALGPLGGVTAYMIWGSPSLIYGAIFTFPIIALAVDRFEPREGSIGRGAWVLLALFAIASTGAKATVLPVALCAVGLVCLVQLVRRRFTRGPWMVAVTLLGAQLLAMLVLYRFKSNGLYLHPLANVDLFLARAVDRPWWKELMVFAFVVAGYGLFMFTRAAGILVFARVGRREWGAAQWFLLGGFIAGAAATLLLWHPSYAQGHFVRTGFAFGAILSAHGAVLLLERHRFPMRWFWGLTALALASVAVISELMWRYGGARTAPGPKEMLPIYRMAFAVFAAGAAVAVVLWLLWRKGLAPKGGPAVALLVFVLCAGAAGLPSDARLLPNAGPIDYHVAVSPDQAKAARWLREHSDPDDLLATNVHCAKPAPAKCASLSFWLSGFAERRVLLESWAYTARANADAAEQKVTQTEVGFWDAALLERNDEAIYRPTEQTRRWLAEQGVRWLVVDRAYGRESPALPGLAQLRFQAGDVAVYELGDV